MKIRDIAAKLNRTINAVDARIRTLKIRILKKKPVAPRKKLFREAAPGTALNVDQLGVGDRIQLSELGKSRIKRAKCRTGTVTGTLRGKLIVLVLFDGNQTPTSLHRSYIEPEISGRHA